MVEYLSDEVLCKMLDHLNVGIQVVDRNGIYLYVNDSMVNQVGIPKKIWIGTSVYEYRTTDICLTDIVLENKQTATAFQDVVIQETNRSYCQITTASPVFDEHGEVIYVISVVEKVPHLENRLRMASQMRVGRQVIQIGADSLWSNCSDLIAESPQMKEVIKLCERVADVDSSVLIQGESGTGKEVVAQYLHKCGKRCGKPLVAINCATLPEHLLEAELFGYEKGAFTGASVRGKKGLVEQADGGILFLDEINSMPLSVQGKLLRVLQTRTVRHIGGLKDISVDFRVIAAANQDLFELCREKNFRSDLLYRLSVVPITLPPLRERPEDILPLTEVFLHDFENLYGKTKYFSDNAKRQLLAYDWPGNVRELRNLVERIVVTSDASVIEIQTIPESMLVSAPSSYTTEEENTLVPLSIIENSSMDFKGLNEYLEECEKFILERVLQQSKSTYEAARILGISQPSVVRKKKKYNIET